jgi:hypothetical protein
MAENWQFYFSYRDGKIASTAVNLALWDVAPDLTRPYLLGIRVKMKNPNERGLSSLSEGSVFDGIDAHLSSALKERFNAIVVGNVTTDGRWEFYYYATSNNEFPAFALEIMRKFRDRYLNPIFFLPRRSYRLAG